MARSREVAGWGTVAGGGGAAAVEKAVRCLGRGVDMTGDLRLKHCKDAGGCLVVRSAGRKAAEKAVVPGFGVVADLPADVRCGKGDRIRFRSDVLEFNKVGLFFLLPSFFLAYWSREGVGKKTNKVVEAESVIS
jgi:hypothetical protein